MSEPPYPPQPPFNPPSFGDTQFLPPQPKRPNPAAIVSLVAGILFCIPLAGIVAVVLTDGEVRPGDPIEAILPKQPHRRLPPV